MELAQPKINTVMYGFLEKKTVTGLVYKLPIFMEAEFHNFLPFFPYPEPLESPPDPHTVIKICL